MAEDWRARIGAWVERLLPWYDSATERYRNARTARVVKRSEVARQRAERAISEYRKAEDVAHRAGERLIDHVK
jgi:hypothetical protein